MSEHVSIQMDSAGNVVSTGQGNTLGKAMAQGEKTPAASGAVYREGGVVYKTQMDEAGNATQTVTRRMAATPPTPSTDPLDSAIGADGFVIPRSRLTSEKGVMISHPRLGGNMPLSEAINLGWARKTADGNFAMAGEFADLNGDAGPAATTPPAVAPKPEQKPDADAEAVSMVGVSGTLATTDVAKSMLVRDAGEVVANGMTMAYIKGLDVDSYASEIASRTGQDPKEVRAAADAVAADYTRAAREVAAANGVANRDGAWSKFIEWASAKNPDAALTAFDAFVSKHEAGPLARLAKQYARSGEAETAFSDEEILNADFGDHIEAVRTNEHGVQLRIPGYEQMSLKAAVARGLVRVRS
jgi:hypothetical protein